LRISPIAVVRHDADQHETAASQRRLTAVLYSPHMAAKNRTKKRKATLDSVLSTVERGFADLEGKMERGFAASPTTSPISKSRWRPRTTSRTSADS
jgi:hypothetical protein